MKTEPGAHHVLIRDVTKIRNDLYRGIIYSYKASSYKNSQIIFFNMKDASLLPGEIIPENKDLYSINYNVF